MIPKLWFLDFVANCCVGISSNVRLDSLLNLAFVSYPSLRYLLLVHLPLQVIRSVPTSLPCHPWTRAHLVFGTRNLSNPPSSFMNFILGRWHYHEFCDSNQSWGRIESLFLGLVPFWLLLYLTFGGESLKSPLRNFQRRGQYLQWLSLGSFEFEYDCLQMIELGGLCYTSECY